MLNVVYLFLGVGGAIVGALALPERWWKYPVTIFFGLIGFVGFGLILHDEFWPPGPSANFRTIPFEYVLGDRAVLASKDGIPKSLIGNPVLLLFRVENIGSNASSIERFHLEAKIGQDRYEGERKVIQAPINFGSATKTISPKNDLNFRIVDAIEPGHSLSGALLFDFPQIAPSVLRSHVRELSLILSFQDIYSKEYLVPFDNTENLTPKTEFPGIIYDDVNSLQ